MNEQRDNAVHELRDGALGALSSHPRWIAARDRWLRSACFVLIGSLWWYFLRSSGEIAQYVSNPSQAAERLLWPATIAAFLLAMIASLSLCGQVVIRIHAQRGEGTSGLDQAVAMSLIGLLVLVGILAPVFATHATALPVHYRLGLHLLGLMPLMAVLMFIRLNKPVEPPRFRAKRRHVWLMLALLALALATWGTLYDIGWTDRPAWALKFYRSIASAYAVLRWCLPAALIFLGIWWTSWHIVPVTDPAAPTEKLTFWTRLRKSIIRFLGTTDHTAAPATPPAWLGELMADLPQGCQIAASSQLRAPAHVSPPSSRADLLPWFGGNDPTLDQAQAIDRLDDALAQSLKSMAESSEMDADFLLLGVPASGRTTTLIAHSLRSVVLRGQRVLWISPSAIKADAALRRIGELTAQLRIPDLLSVQRIAEHSARNWRGELNVILPDILLGTLEELELYVLGDEDRDAASIARMAAVHTLIDAIIIDDPLEMTDSHLAHLPFAIDKVRLIMSSSSFSPQVIISAALIYSSPPALESCLLQVLVLLRLQSKSSRPILTEKTPTTRICPSSIFPST